MKKVIVTIILALLFCTKITAQSVSEIVDRVWKAQSSIRKVAYNMVRHDTLVTGDVRTITGSVKMQADTADKLFGFQFWAKEQGVASEIVFNGNMAYETDDDQRMYRISTNPSDMNELLYHPGGRVVMPDLMKLDTSGAKSFQISDDERFYYLMVLYPDLTAYNVTNRFKKITIDKLKMLPVTVTRHQETLGKVQDLTWNIQDLRANEQSLDYNYASPPFLKTHSQKIPEITVKHPGQTHLNYDQMKYPPRPIGHPSKEGNRTQIPSLEGCPKGGAGKIHNKTTALSNKFFKCVCPVKHPQMSLTGKPAPMFELKSFEGKVTSLSKTYGKVVLLDFWEVWCGPCIASMPKVQHLYDKFKDKGLIVYGITCETKQVEVSKRFMQGKPEIKFPMLTGNEDLKKDYLISAVPQYVLIGRDGRIRFLSLGYADQIETEIEKALNAK